MKAELAKPFAKKDDLVKARTDHREVINKLKKAGGGIEMTPEMLDELNAEINLRLGGAAGPVLSIGAELPESKWMSLGESTQIVEEFATKFLHEVPVIIADRPADVLGTAAGADDAAGMVWNGRVYVFRSGIADCAQLVQTLFHEFLHYGIRRFLPREQYINTMRQMYDADAWVKQKAVRWVSGEEGPALLKDGEDQRQGESEDRAGTGLA